MITNPEVTSVAVNATPTLVFSGCGKVKFSPVQAGGAGRVYFGDANVSNANNLTQWEDIVHLGSFAVQFEANAEVYAICSAGTSGNVRVTRYF